MSKAKKTSYRFVNIRGEKPYTFVNCLKYFSVDKSTISRLVKNIMMEKVLKKNSNGGRNKIINERGDKTLNKTVRKMANYESNCR